MHGPHERAGGAKVLTVQQWQLRNGAFDFHIAEQPGDAQAPRAVEGVPTETRGEAECGLGRGYG